MAESYKRETQQLFIQAISQLKNAKIPSEENALDVCKMKLFALQLETYWHRL